jgi:hypothetical protein
MFAGCLQIMWAHLHSIRAEGVGYSQIIRAENTDVCRSCDLCLQAATSRLRHKGRAANAAWYNSILFNTALAALLLWGNTPRRLITPPLRHRFQLSSNTGAQSHRADIGLTSVHFRASVREYLHKVPAFHIKATKFHHHRPSHDGVATPTLSSADF